MVPTENRPSLGRLAVFAFISMAYHTMYSDNPTAKYLREYRKKKRGPDYIPTRTGRWKPGESGNPLGRPRRLPFTEAQTALLDKLGDFEALKAKLSTEAAGELGMTILGPALKNLAKT